VDAVLDERQLELIQQICERVLAEAGASLAFVVDSGGQLIASAGDPGDLDSDALALLAHSNADVANLLDEKECVILQSRQNLVFRLVGGGLILLVIFGAASGLEQVRGVTQRAAEEIEGLLGNAA
jgi:hypothetical protein